MRHLQDEEWRQIFSFLDGKQQGVRLASLSHRFERYVMESVQFLGVTLNFVDGEGGPYVRATDIGRRAEHDGAHWIDPVIQIGTAQTRPLLTLVERSAYEDCSFHAVFRTSYEARKAASAFCDKRGKYRLECVRDASGTADVNGFLFIDRLHRMKIPTNIDHLKEVDIERWRREVQELSMKGPWEHSSRVPFTTISLALRRLLKETALGGRWSIVVCEPRGEADMRALMQAGFQQAKELVCRGDGNYLFAVPAFLDVPMLPGCAVSAMPIVEESKMPGALPPPTGNDDKLGDDIAEALAMELFGGQVHVLKLNSRIQQRIADGASVERSCVLHQCAARGRPDLLALCLSLADPTASAANAFDSDQQTPLMSAVTSDVMPDKMDACVDALIEARADVNVTDANGLTALGHLWRKARGNL